MYAKVIADKHEDVMAKFGATLAQGIIDAGDLLRSFNLVFKYSLANLNPLHWALLPRW
mgnify:CR=1 FL=1